MALVLKETVTLQHPSEPDTWFKIRRPLTSGDMKALGAAENLADVKFLGVRRALLDWSYSEALTDESLGLLDITSFNWLAEQVFEGSQRPEPEKKDSEPPSSPTTEEAADSPASSGT